MRRIIAAILLATSFLLPVDTEAFGSTVQADRDCDWLEIQRGLCEAGGDPGLAIGGQHTEPGEQPPAQQPQPGPPGGQTQPIVGPGPGPGPGTGPAQPAVPGGEPGGWQCLDPAQQIIGGTCTTVPEPDPEPAEEPAPVEQPPSIPPLTAFDVANFVPSPAPPTIEPFGVAIARAPMNVAVAASAHTVGGDLFGLPMSVTFNPEFLTIDYGDGTIVDVEQGAPTWEQLGQEQLSPTATSHTYAERGTASVTVDVSYSAVVDFGPWGVHPVGGYVVAQGAPVDVHIYEKQSYLVAHTCAENPSGPGC